MTKIWCRNTWRTVFIIKNNFPWPSSYLLDTVRRKNTILSISSQVIILFFSKFRLKPWRWFKRNFTRRVCWFIVFTFERLIINIRFFFPTFLYCSFVKNKLTTSILLWPSVWLLRSIWVWIHIVESFTFRRVLISTLIFSIVGAFDWLIKFRLIIHILTKNSNGWIWFYFIVVLLSKRIVTLMIFLVLVKIENIFTLRTNLILMRMVVWILEIHKSGICLILMRWMVFSFYKFFHLSGPILLKGLFFLFRIVVRKRILTVKDGLVLIITIILFIISLFFNELFVSKRLSVSIKMLLSVLRILVIILIRIFFSD